jgi:hypothetical protein
MTGNCQSTTTSQSSLGASRRVLEGGDLGALLRASPEGGGLRREARGGEEAEGGALEEETVGEGEAGGKEGEEEEEEEDGALGLGLSGKVAGRGGEVAEGSGAEEGAGQEEADAAGAVDGRALRRSRSQCAPVPRAAASAGSRTSLDKAPGVFRAAVWSPIGLCIVEKSCRDPQSLIACSQAVS